MSKKKNKPSANTPEQYKKPAHLLKKHEIAELFNEDDHEPSKNKSSLSISISNILPPEVLEEYEKTIPGFKNKFFEHWDENQKTRRALALKESERKDKMSGALSFSFRLTSISVFLVIAGILGLAVYLIYQGNFKEAVALVGGMAGLGVIGSWLSNKKSE